MSIYSEKLFTIFESLDYDFGKENEKFLCWKKWFRFGYGIG